MDIVSGAAPLRIAGGGIGGLTTALCLLHHGIECTVHERAPALNEIGAGVGLWPGPVSVFDQLGLGDAVRGLTGSWETAGLLRADGRYLKRYTADQMTKRLGGVTIGVHRGELQALLLDALPAGVVHTGEAVERVDPRDDRVLVHLEDGRELVASAVIAADGRHSRIRAQLFGRARLHECGSVSWRGTTDVPDGADWRAVAGEWWGGDMVVGILPLNRGRVSWYAAARSFEGDGGLDELRRRCAHFAHPIPAVLAATPPEALWRDQIDDLWPSRRWTAGRVALLGDAAHPMAPDLGNGACQAILDAWRVAGELAVGDDPAAAFRRYQRARWARASFVTLAARALDYGAGFRDDPLAPVRRVGLQAMPRSVLLSGIRALGGPPRVATVPTRGVAVPSAP